MSSWEYWINEPVFVNSSVQVIQKRKEALFLFVTEGLVPMIHRAGYRFRYSDGQLTKIMLRLIYTIKSGKSVKPLKTENDDTDDDHYILYNYLLDSSTWEQFWHEWRGFQDFEEGRAGYKLRFWLPAYIWSWIDLENSPAAIRLEKELQEQEYQDEFSKGKDDPYLQENVKRDYQDRHW